MEAVVNYKRKIASRFIPIEGPLAQTELPESDSFIYSEKLDGHIAYAVVKEGKVSFYNRSANPLDLPSLQAAFPSDKTGIWAGELYLAQDRSRSFQVTSAIVNDKEKLRFAVFDAVHELNKLSYERIKIVQDNIPIGELVHPMKWMKTDSRKELVKFYNEAVESGKEGLVVHNNLGLIYKLKPMVELDVTVLAYSIKEDGSGIRALLVGVHDGEGWIVVTSVGGGFSEEMRVSWLSTLQNIECESDIVLVANNRLAYKWVKPEIVIQMKCIEIISEDSSGIIRKDKLEFVGDHYESHGKTNGVSLISPVFLGVRKDKVAGPDDTGINQVTSRIEMTEGDDDENDILLRSEIIHKEVYIKESKTGTAIRKFVGIKTNKTLDQSFPPYFMFYTDFSAGRKEPLQTEIKLASTSEKLSEIMAKAIEENVKKGWEKI